MGHPSVYILDDIQFARNEQYHYYLLSIVTILLGILTFYFIPIKSRKGCSASLVKLDFFCGSAQEFPFLICVRPHRSVPFGVIRRYLYNYDNNVVLKGVSFFALLLCNFGNSKLWLIRHPLEKFLILIKSFSTGCNKVWNLIMRQIRMSNWNINTSSFHQTNILMCIPI